MEKKISSALISVFHKEGLDDIIALLSEAGITIYSTGGTQKFIEGLGVKCKAVEELTNYPSILGGRVKTLHPKVFGGILARRDNENDRQQLKEYEIPEIDLVIVDLYPFEETVKNTTEEQAIIEKIDIGGVSLIRAAAKNFKDVVTIASQKEYQYLKDILTEKGGETTLEERRTMAARAFQHCAHYDIAIADYFTKGTPADYFFASASPAKILRYGENPHQTGIFYGNFNEIFEQLHGKEISYNNLVDLDAAWQLISEFEETTFVVIKHTNVCGIAMRETLKDAWEDALAGDKESAFGGVLICNRKVDKATAQQIHEIFFEILIAPDFDEDALNVLQAKKNRILLKQKESFENSARYKKVVNGVLQQDDDKGNYIKWEEVARPANEEEKKELEFANIVCKHLKSNAIALIKNRQLIGKGCGQTSRVDALRQAIDKARQFNFDLQGAVMASDAFFPFDDCVSMAHETGVTAVIQPGGSIRDKDSVDFCNEHDMAMVMTGMRHFRH